MSKKAYIVIKDIVDHRIGKSDILGVYTSEESARKVKRRFDQLYDITIIESEIDGNADIDVKFVFEINLDHCLNPVIRYSYDTDEDVGDLGINEVVFSVNLYGYINATTRVNHDSGEVMDHELLKEEALSIVRSRCEEIMNGVKVLAIRTNLKLAPHFIDENLIGLIDNNLAFIETSDVSRESVTIFNELLASFASNLSRRCLADIFDRYFRDTSTPPVLYHIGGEVNCKLSKFGWYDEKTHSLNRGIIEFLKYGADIFDDR